MITGLSFFKIYTAFRLHFNSDYDVIKYKGKVPHVEDTFNKNTHKRLFEQWGSKTKNPKHASELCLGNFVRNSDGWIYEIQDDALTNHKRWKEIQENLDSFLLIDAEYIKQSIIDKGLTYDTLIGKDSSKYKSTLLQMFLTGRIIPETVLILDSSNGGFLKEWAITFKKDPLVSSQLFRLDKYKSFANIGHKSHLNIFSTINTI